MVGLFVSGKGLSGTTRGSTCLFQTVLLSAQDVLPRPPPVCELLPIASTTCFNCSNAAVKRYQNYSALASPAFTKEDLQDFYKNFDEERGGYDKETLLEMIGQNPNG